MKIAAIKRKYYKDYVSVHEYILYIYILENFTRIYIHNLFKNKLPNVFSLSVYNLE